MKNDYTLQKTITVLDDLASGINPFTGDELSDTDIVNDIRVSRYLFIALGVLREKQVGARARWKNPDPDDDVIIESVSHKAVRRPIIIIKETDVDSKKINGEKTAEPRETDPDGIVFYLDSRDGIFRGKLVVTPEGKYILKAGTRVSLEVKDNFRSANAVRSRREMAGIDEHNLVLGKDVTFNSSTAAGEFVCGSTCCGPFRWKTSDGVRMQDMPEMEHILKSKTETNILKEID